MYTMATQLFLSTYKTPFRHRLLLRFRTMDHFIIKTNVQHTTEI